MNRVQSILLALSLIMIGACTESPVQLSAEQQQTASNAGDDASRSPDMSAALTPATRAPVCDKSIELPPGFCAEIYHPGVGRGARHLAVRNSTDVYIAMLGEAGRLMALRDSDRDGAADVQEVIMETSGTGVELNDGYLYFTTPTQVMRFALDANELLPPNAPEVVIGGYPDHRQHASKGIAFDQENGLYVNVGAPSNACQEPSRTPGAAGQDPCPWLETTGGVWRFDVNKTDQNGLTDGTAFATGIRNGLAIAWRTTNNKLYVAQHGRDQLSEFWPDLFTPEQRAELPAEQLFEVDQGDHLGWPFCYYDHRKQQKLLNPEYGGDGSKVGRCERYEDPVAAYPGHWAPNDMVFYSGDAYPLAYQGGAFIAFHGSWNRAPFPQQGYRVVFQPFNAAHQAEEFITFADGFAGTDDLKSPGDAVYRPMGLALDELGRLWISDSRKGRIWRVSYQGT